MVDVLRVYNIASCTLAVVLAIAVLAHYMATITVQSRSKAWHIILVASSHVGFLITGGLWSWSKLGDDFTAVLGHGFSLWTLPLAVFSTESNVAMVFMLIHLANERRRII